MINENIIKQIKDYAEVNSIPIMNDAGIKYLMEYINKNNIKKILEIGTAIGYSAIMMCSVDENVTVTTIERDEKRYLEALKNIKKLNLEDRITLIYNDALETRIDDLYDLIFIDAAKAQNRRFFERFEGNLITNGTIITDNMSFHGLVNKDINEIESRNVRGLVKKVRDYQEFLRENNKYVTEFLDIGDGIAVSHKITK